MSFADFEDLRARLREAEETLRAIRSGDADGLVIAGPGGDQVFALQGTELPYRIFIQEMNEGALVLSAEGLILFCNRRFAKLLGVEPAELVGRHLAALEHEALRVSVETLLADHDGSAGPKEFVCTSDGVSRILRVVSTRMAHDGSMAFLLTDVTETRSREHELRRSNEEMDDRIRERTAALESANRALELQIAGRRESEKAQRLLFTAVEQAAESILITNTAGIIEYVNPAFEKISGFTRAEAVGQSPRILKSGMQDAAFYASLWKTLTSGSVWHGHFVNQRKDGGLYQEEATLSPVHDDTGALTHFVAIKRDVTAEVALAAQLQHAQKIEAIGMLAGGVAHDFNNLLQAMLSIVQVLKKRVMEPATDNHVKHLEETVRRGAALTRQLLIFARHETAKLETLDLNEIIRDLASLLRRIVRENIKLSIEVWQRPLRIHGDRGQIEQVVMNLALNAADAMFEGGTLSIATGFDRDSAWLTVSDAGHGISEHIRDRIFEPFFTTREAGRGTGLGLAVVHGIVTGHGGTIEFESPAEGGTVFRIGLPLLTAVAPTQPLLEDDVPNGNGERLLLVEDDPTAREGLAGILEILGYSVVAVGSGEEAFSLNPAAPFSVVLTDFMLPGVQGLDVVRELRHRAPAMHAIVMSGYATPGTVEAAIQSGEIRFLQKPFDMSAVARTLRDLLHPDTAPDRTSM